MRRPGRSAIFAALTFPFGCVAGDADGTGADREVPATRIEAQRPADVPSLHHVMLNSVNPDVAID